MTTDEFEPLEYRVRETYGGYIPEYRSYSPLWKPIGYSMYYTLRGAEKACHKHAKKRKLDFEVRKSFITKNLGRLPMVRDSSQSVTANPGSGAALKQGCTCAVMDNHYGKGVDFGDGPIFWVSGSCKLHSQLYDYSAFS